MLKNKKMKKYLSLTLLVLMLTFNFMTNFLSREVIGKLPFERFQMDSENLVVSKINYDNNMYEDGKCEYGLCYYDKEEGKIYDYKSQIGLQGYVFSFLSNTFKLSTKKLNIITSLSLATVLVSICYFISKKYDKLLASIFYITFFLSPWIIAFARNLYWVSFTWFIPGLLGLMYSIYYKKKKIFIPLIYLSILIKCLCGYEYITTIMLSTIVFHIIDFFVVKGKEKKIKVFKTIFVIGIVCLLAFSTSLIIHGFQRGNGNILVGVEDIYKKDVLRRTIITTDKDSYTGAMRDSMDASVKDVMKMYIYSWNTDIIYGVNSKLFPIIIFVSFVICVINIFDNYKYNKRDLIMYLMFLITTISWFILGKSHSYIHTHMNFVLWYFGFIQVSLYIIIKFIIYKINYIKLKEI